LFAHTIFLAYISVITQIRRTVESHSVL